MTRCLSVPDASTPSVNEPAMTSFSLNSKAKVNIIEAEISGKLVTSGISDIAFVSVSSEKTPYEEVLDYDNN